MSRSRGAGAAARRRLLGFLGPERLLDRGTPEVRGCARPRRRGCLRRCGPEWSGASRTWSRARATTRVQRSSRSRRSRLLRGAWNGAGSSSATPTSPGDQRAEARERRASSRDLRGDPGGGGRAFARHDPRQPRKHGSRRAQTTPPPAPTSKRPPRSIAASGISSPWRTTSWTLGSSRWPRLGSTTPSLFLRESLAICRADRLGDLLPWAVEAVAAAAARSRCAGGRGPPARRDDQDTGGAGDGRRLLSDRRGDTGADARAARAQLSEPAFAAAWAEGEALSLEEAARAGRLAGVSSEP